MDDETLKEMASLWRVHISCFECPIRDKCLELGGVCDESFYKVMRDCKERLD